MDDQCLKYLWDALKYSTQVETFVEGFTQDALEQDIRTLLAVEKCFLNIGEALNRIKRTDASILENIRDHHKIIGFRNVLAHGYDSIDPDQIWFIIQTALPLLIEDLRKIPELDKHI